MPKLDLSKIAEKSGSTYPAPFDEPCRGRRFRRLGEAGGLKKLGVTIATLPPGSWSSQRHWHVAEDEFLYMISGELVMVTDAGEEIVRAGDMAAWPAGVPDGHCLQNRSDADAVFLAISNRDDGDAGEYPDIDLKFAGNRYAGQSRFLHKDGRPY
jgi:uncharacterized cupin superfamily protein